MISIFAATEADIPQIMAIECEAFSPPWTHDALLSEIHRGDSFFAVACMDDGSTRKATVLGFVIFRQMADEGELLQIASDKAARRCGVADMLMGAALGFAGSNNIRSIFLEVRKSNEAAIALYKKHGFSSVRFRKDYYSSPIEDAVVMALSYD